MTLALGRSPEDKAPGTERGLSSSGLIPNACARLAKEGPQRISSEFVKKHAKKLDWTHLAQEGQAGSARSSSKMVSRKQGRGIVPG